MSIDSKRMKLKKFPPQILDRIEKALDRVRAEGQSPVAAFDADGTLWKTDLGESFFKFQIENQLVANLPPNPWEHYRKMKASGDPRPAYLWLAQICKDQRLEKVWKWAEDCVQKMGSLPIFEEQAQLIEWLHQQKVQVYVVTASVKWAVEPGALRLGIPRERVLGVATQVENGIVTDLQAGTITYREGKATALLEATSGTKPFFSSGNTMGDEHLLEISSDVRLAVRSEAQGHELFETEGKLSQTAENRNWFRFQFQ